MRNPITGELFQVCREEPDLIVNEVKTKSKPSCSVNPLLPQIPFLLGLLAPRKSGKTNLLVDSLLDHNKYKGKFDKIYVWSQTYHLDPKWRRLDLDPECVFTTWDENRCKEIVAETSEAVQEDPSLQVLFIWDDMIDAKIMRKNDMGCIESIAVRGRHSNISVIIISQMFKSLSTPIRNNMTNLVVFRIRNNNELKKMSEENQESLSTDQFQQIYDFATGTPFSFLHINNQEPDPRLRFRKNWNIVIELNDQKL